MSSDPKFLRNRPELPRSARKKKNARVMLAFLGILIAIVAAASWFTWVHFTSPDQFVVTKLVVNGVTFADLEQIRVEVGENAKTNMLFLNLQDVCREVEQVPWVKSATARKVLPDTLHLEIVEARPLAFAILEKDLYLVDAEGELIDYLRTEHPFADMPVINGLSGLEEKGIYARLESGARLLKSIKSYKPSWFNRISQVNLSKADAVEVFLRDGRAPLIITEKSALSQLQKYFLIEAKLNERYDAIDYIDARFKRRVFVKATGK